MSDPDDPHATPRPGYEDPSKVTRRALKARELAAAGIDVSVRTLGRKAMAKVLSFIRAHEDMRGNRPELQYFLAGAGEHDHVEMPAAVHRVLLQVLEAMRAGKAVTVVPQSKLLTTQQAADLLGVSRPTVVKLIDQGVLAGEVPGRRRRMVKLDDLLEYRGPRRDAQYRALLESSADDDESPEDAELAQERFRRIRAEVAAERRARTVEVQKP